MKHTTYFLTADPICTVENPLLEHKCENENCPYKVKSEIISKISKAKDSIDIAVFQFRISDIANEVISARKRFVDIRIMVDKSMFNQGGYPTEIIKMLLSNGKILHFFHLQLYEISIYIYLLIQALMFVHLIRRN